MTVLGKLEEYVSQLENAVNQLRQENEELKKTLARKTAQGSLADELQE
jgi:cell shape-determining protein MreC